jgi:mannonate dehydratase
MLQLNRLDEPIKYLLLKEDWHRRLINGSDYPLPGILPIIPLKQIVRMGLLQQPQADVLSEVRRYNPLWFDFLLKRMLRWQGKGFANNVFETRRHFIQSTG